MIVMDNWSFRRTRQPKKTEAGADNMSHKTNKIMAHFPQSTGPHAICFENQNTS